MNRIMGAAVVLLAVLGGVLAIVSEPGRPSGEKARQELVQASDARDAAEKALAAARSEVERATAAASAAKADADVMIAKLRHDAEAALMSAKAEANKAVAAALVEADRKLAAARAEADSAIAAAKAEAEKATSGDRLAAARAEAERVLAAARREAEQAIATTRAEAEKAAASLRDQLGQCRAASEKKPDGGESLRCSTAALSPGAGPIAAADIARELAASGSIALYGIEFDTGSAKLTAGSRASLDEVAKVMQEDPRLKLLVVGHTDNKGDFNINRNLSEQRALAVVTDLVTRLGADRARLSSAGVADLAPVSTNDTEEGRARNRRVEFVKR